MTLLQTPSQTVGPFFAYGLTPEQYSYDFKEIANGNMLKSDSTEGIITIKGQVLDGHGQVIPDAMIEFWQNDNQTFGRFGTGTEKDNNFVFQTIKPKSINGQAPFITVMVLMRGLLVHAYTRLYFSDEIEANQHDEVLNSVPENRRNTLIAQKTNHSNYRFDIKMQGEGETVFFDV